MTSKISSAKLIKEAVKRGGAFGILLLLFFFCYYPLAGMMAMGNMSGYEPISENTALIFREFHDYIINEFMLTMIFLIACIMGILQFSYLHSREKLDFYHSLPVRREKLFGVQYAAGILLFLVPLAGNMLLYFLICALKGVAGILGGVLLRGLVAYICCYLLVYSLSVLAMMVTGKLFAALCGLQFLMGYLPAVCAIWELFMQSFFVTYVPAQHLENNMLLRCSPIYAFVYVGERLILHGEENLKPYPADILLALFLISLLVAGLCLLLYRRRPSEKAGSPMVFRGLARVVKFILVVPAAAMFSLFLYGIGNYNIFWGLFGWLFGILLFCGMIEFIYCMDIREVFRDRRQIVLAGAVTLLILAFFRCDLLGYDKWLPKSEAVESVSIDVPDYAAFALPKEKQYYLAHDGVETDVYEPVGERRTTFTSGNVEDALNLVKRSVSFVHKYKSAEDAYRIVSNLSEEIRAHVVWKMKDGTEKERMYIFSGEEFSEGIAPFFEAQESRNVIYPILTTDPEDVLGVFVDYVYAGDDSRLEVPDEEFSKKQKPEDAGVQKQETEEEDTSEASYDLDETWWTADDLEATYIQVRMPVAPKQPLTLPQMRELAQAYCRDVEHITPQQVMEGKQYILVILYRNREDGNIYATRYPINNTGYENTWKLLKKYYDLEEQEER